MLFLPPDLIRGILLLCLAGQAVAEQCPTEDSSAKEPLTLWDVGFSLQTQWGRLPGLGDQSPACPVPDDPPEAEPPVEQPKGQSDFVSFEEWKRIRQAEEDARPPERPKETIANVLPSDKEEQPSLEPESSEPSVEIDMPKSSGNRYNYASPDCSARIHSASPQTQHASAILHKSRDRYMLTPCKSNQHYVIVELCDEIRIESLEIAVWEFFSGVVRDVKLSVGEDGDEKDWKEVASFVARNVRGAQVRRIRSACTDRQTFALPEPTSFHRFIRIDFPTHYGSEYYCPVSQLKVFGMNQMEAFKWEQKHLASSQKDRERERAASRDAEAQARKALDVEEKARQDRQRKQEEAKREQELGELEKLVHRQALRAYPEALKSVSASSIILTASHTPSTSMTPSPLPASASSTTSSLSNSAATANASRHETTANSTEAHAVKPQSNSTEAQSAKHTPRGDHSESIYATITRRLNALEGNSSLIARYIEEQSRVMRAALGALERDWDEWRFGHDAEERSKWEQEVRLSSPGVADDSECDRKTAWGRSYHSWSGNG